MKKIILILFVFSMINACKQNKPMINYPETRKSDHIDTYFGKQIADPYDWLENDTSKETEEWVKAQNAVTESWLAKIPYRIKIKERLTALWNYPKYGTPFKEGDYYYYFKNSGLQQQSVLYRTKSLEIEPEVFFDPNKLSADGTVALAGFDFSADGKYFSYAIARSGSDWNEFYIMTTTDGKLLSDHLLWIKFSGMAWAGDGFYYSRFEVPKGSELATKNQNQKIYFHKVGTDQSKDQLVWEDKNAPDVLWSASTTEDEQYLIISGSASTSGNSIYYKNLKLKDKEFTCLEPGFDNENDLIGNVGEELIIRTNKNAKNFRLVNIDTKNKDSLEWKTIIPESKHLLEYINLRGGKIIAGYLEDVVSKAYVFDVSGKKLNSIQFPGIGSVGGFSGKEKDTLVFFSFTSFLSPTTIFSYDILKNEVKLFKKSEINFDFDKYETKQVFYTSKDGTKIPMFITCKKGIELNGENPALLYGYGGFNVSMGPAFSISTLVFLENGGVYAHANLRGGSEYGEAWHEAGMRFNKQNVFDDFIAAAQYLIDQKYTCSEKLAIRGGSNGGLLVGACMTQRPDLFRVALPAVGVMDMLKYHKFTIGYLWTEEYGSSDSLIDFENLVKYSPLHNLKKGTCYPATLVTTADHDDRVVPAHSFKFAATLQECQSCSNPALIRIESKAGHSSGKPTSKIIDEYTDIWTFVFKNLEIDPVYKQ